MIIYVDILKVLSGLICLIVRQKVKIAKGNKISEKSHLGSVSCYHRNH